MVAPPLVALNVAPLNAPHKELEWLPLADNDFEINDIMANTSHLEAFCEIGNNHRNKTDIFGIWESNMPMYYLPCVNVFRELIHQCHANYEPTQRAVMCPCGIILFYITPE